MSVKKIFFLISVVIVLLLGKLFYFIYDTEPVHVGMMTKITNTFVSFVAYPNPKVYAFVMKHISPKVSSTDDFDFSKFKFAYKNENKLRVELQMGIYTPKTIESSVNEFPIILFYHGGGLRVGQADDAYSFLSQIAKEKKAVILSPDYRLTSDGFTRKEIYQDAYEAFKWTVNKYGKDRKYVISGESAGGKLSILMNQMLRDDNYDFLDKENLLIIPIYPWICSPKCPFEFKYQKLYKKGFFTNERNDKICLKNKNEGEYYEILNNTQNLAGIALLTCEYDYLKEEGLKYFKEHKKHNEDVYAEHLEASGEIHGFTNSGSGITKNIKERIGLWMLEQIDTAFAKKN